LTKAARVEAVAVGDPGLARDLIRRAPCSVWFVPEGPRPALRRLLVPIDFSVRGADCLRVAVTLARLAGAAECVALRVYSPQSVLTGPVGERAARRAAWEAFDRFARPIDTLGVTVRPCFREAGDVPRAIRETAAEAGADLVVMASRGRTPAATLLGPTVAERTVPGCPAPLLVVKHFGAARDFVAVLADRLRRPQDNLPPE
jgi:nucleotide-binding universal stress UspA family protein